MLRHYELLGLDYERDNKKKNPILGFRGEFRFLSNFYVRDVTMRISKSLSIQFRSGEHAFMWHKSRNKKYRQQIMEAVSPAEAKRLGSNHRLEAMGLLREDWRDDKVRVQVMYDVLKAKYDDYWMREALLNTGTRYLEETNHWNDTFYGRCNGVGANNLGRLSMCVRYESK